MSDADDALSPDRRPRTRPWRSLVTVGAVLATGAATLIPAQSATAALVAPVSIDGGADASVTEGATLTRSIAIVDGEDNGAVGWSYAIDYGDGSPVVTGATVTPSVELSHLFPDGPATRTVSVSVVDHLGLIDEVAIDSFVVTVANVSPTPVLTGNASLAEGATYFLNVNGADPGGVFDPLSYTPDWGDGSLTAQVFRPIGIASHVFLDDQDGPINATTRTVTTSMIDDDGGFATGTFPVAVTNVAPVIALSGAATVAVGTPYSLTLGAITDPGRDTVTSRVIRWGDGSSEAVTSSGTVTHSYTTGGAKTVTVELTDEDGTFVGGTLTVTATLVAPTAPANPTAAAITRARSPSPLSAASASTLPTTIATLAPLTAVRWVRPLARRSASTSGESVEVSPRPRVGSSPAGCSGSPWTASRRPARTRAAARHHQAGSSISWGRPSALNRAMTSSPGSAGSNRPSARIRLPTGVEAQAAPPITSTGRSTRRRSPRAAAVSTDSRSTTRVSPPPQRPGVIGRGSLVTRPVTSTTACWPVQAGNGPAARSARVTPAEVSTVIRPANTRSSWARSSVLGPDGGAHSAAPSDTATHTPAAAHAEAALTPVAHQAADQQITAAGSSRRSGAGAGPDGVLTP
jgi:hypothetical protein